MTLLRSAAVLTAALSLLLAAGCVSDMGEWQTQTSDVQEDTSREPIVVRVPVRFTRNDLEDVGTFFSSSWVPFTDVGSEPADGYEWARHSLEEAEQIADWIAPDEPGAGYATAWFLVEIPYDTDGEIAYSLARVKLETELIRTEIASTFSRTYSPLRVRRGGDQPCLSITAGGELEGKLKAIDLPFEDEGFTERDWNLSDTDESGVPIAKVIVGTLRFQATCWPENVEGDTRISTGLAGGVGAVNGFAMVDQGNGQLSSSHAAVYVNLVENDNGEVSVGELFSSSATVLRPREIEAFNAAAAEFHDRFVEEAEDWKHCVLHGVRCH